MPTLTVGKLRAVVEVDTSQLKKAKTDVKGFGMDIKGAFKSINRSIRNTGLLATAAISVPLVMFGTASVKAASNAVEMANVFNETFISIREQSNRTALSLASDFGLADSTSKQLLGSVGDLMVGFGLTEEAALSLANRTLRIAGELTSFKNIAGGIPAATNAIMRGMLGVSQALKSVGVSMNQRSKEFRSQIREMMATKGMTEQVARAEAVLQAVYNQSPKAIGDVKRTWFELANSARRLSEMTKFMREEFGKILIQGLRLDIVIVALGKAMRILAKTLSIIPGFLRPIIGGFVLLAIAIPPVVVGFAVFNLAVLHLQKNSIGLTQALRLQSFFLRRYLVPGLSKAIAKLRTFAIVSRHAKFSLISFKEAGAGISLMFGKIGASLGVAKTALAGFVSSAFVALLGAVAFAVGSIAFAFIRIKNSIPKSDLVFLKDVMHGINISLGVTWNILKAIGKTIVEVVSLVIDSITKISRNAIFNLDPRNAIKAIASGEFGRLNLLGDVAPIFKVFDENMKKIAADVVKSTKAGTPLIKPTAGTSDVSAGIVTSPELAGAAIRGTSEAVKIETQRSANKKVEENTRKTAMNTEKMASAFINNQVVLMPANIAT